MSTISRRDVLKAAVVASAAVWVAPEIDTTVASAQGQPFACCACYEGDPVVNGQPEPGPFLGAAVGHFTDAECSAFCAGVAPAGEKGVALHFTSVHHSFNVSGSASVQPGCHYDRHWLNRVIVPPGPPDGPGYHSHCPPEKQLKPLGVHCDRTYWSVPAT